MSSEELRLQGQAFNVTQADLLEAKELAKTFTLDDTRQLMVSIYKQHSRDPNFPMEIIDAIEQFLGQSCLPHDVVAQAEANPPNSQRRGLHQPREILPNHPRN